MQEPHIPMRQCLGCGERLPKSELIRVLRTPDGQIVIDTSHKGNGRGAYLCGSENCIKRLRKSRRMDSVLGTAVPDEIFEKISKEFVPKTES